MVVMLGGHATPHWDPRRDTHLIRLSAKLSQWDSKESKVPLIPCLETLQECENALASQFRRFLVIMLVFTRPIESQLDS